MPKKGKKDYYPAKRAVILLILEAFVLAAFEKVG